jgi:hypothetical protein
MTVLAHENTRKKAPPEIHFIDLGKKEIAAFVRHTA